MLNGMEEYITVICPLCGQSFPVELDVTGGNDQVYVEDCEICCRPIRFHISCDEAGEWSCEASGET